MKIFVIDEADKMVSRGFDEHILSIHRLLPVSTQSVSLSTTMPHEVLEMATSLSRDPLHIGFEKGNEYLLDGVKQSYIAAENEGRKLDTLIDLSEIYSSAQAVIFCNKRRTVEWLAEELTGHGLAASAMHGDMPAFERAGILETFRSGSTRMLVATNLLARGIDAQLSLLVVNYDLPTKKEDYLHRTSTASEGASTINLTTAAEVGTIHDIEDYYSTHVEEASIPPLLRPRA